MAGVIAPAPSVPCTLYSSLLYSSPVPRSPCPPVAFPARSPSSVSHSSLFFIGADGSRPRCSVRRLNATVETLIGFVAESDKPSTSSSIVAEPVPLLPQPASAPELGFGDPSTWFKSRMIRGVSMAAPFLFGALFGNAVAHAAAEHSIGTSSLGLKVASFLRRSGLSDEAIVASVASLPALELRGAIPVGYWMKLPPVKTYALAVIGNMLPVPLIALYLEKLFKYVASSSEGGQRLVDKIIMNTRRKAEPIEEFRWIGLMLFVAVPFPGTGAWTGAFAASILGMSFWESMSANFVGVLLAGLLVNLVVSVGVREAVFVGIVLFLLSLFMWRILRFFNQKKASDA